MREKRQAVSNPNPWVKTQELNPDPSEQTISHQGANVPEWLRVRDGPEAQPPASQTSSLLQLCNTPSDCGKGETEMPD